VTSKLDLVVIGTGAGASGVATRCRERGWSVAMVDSRPYGGTCALRGCEPKKVLVSAAHALDAARSLRGKGVEGDVRIAWPELMAFKRTFTEPIPPSREQSFAKAGIVMLHGDARFEGPGVVAVGAERYEAGRFHLATGARPAPLPIPGAELLTTSDAFLELETLPPRLLFLGSGFISFEFAHVAAIAGAQVTMLERAAQPLAGFDPDLVALLVARTRALGIELRLSTQVRAIERRGAELSVRCDGPGGEQLALACDRVVHGAGRVPDLDRLELARAGVAYDARGITVNPYMQSVSNPAVYAAGDAAAGGLPLTPVAALEAEVAAANLIEGNHRAIGYPPTPSVVFTSPPLAAVGLREDQAREQGLKFDVRHARTSSWSSSRRAGEEFSAHKILIEQGSGRILGAHLLGPRADEIINLFALAMRTNLSASELEQTLFAYPTFGSDVVYML